MKVLLTGITGNLGYEVSLDLAKRGIVVVPCVRPGKKSSLSSHPIKFNQIIEVDLVGEEDIHISEEVDCVVHCAGAVQFRGAKDQNERMMAKVCKFAKGLNIPVYAVSTAFVYRPNSLEFTFNNEYEEDKFHAEQVLVSSGVPYCILRPSVLTGNSYTGDIKNFSGYYFMVRAFISAIHSAIENNRVIRFPRMQGESNMIPVDQAAECIGRVVEGGRLGETIYITNPLPPRSDWVLGETLDFYKFRDKVAVLDVSFEEFGKLNLTEEETRLYKFSLHFNPYWSMRYEFPKSICKTNLIDHDYIIKILSVFSEVENSSHD